MSYIFNGCSKSFLRRCRLQQIKVNTTSKITATATNSPVKIASIITSVSTTKVDESSCYILIGVADRTRINCLNCDTNNPKNISCIGRVCPALFRAFDLLFHLVLMKFVSPGYSCSYHD